MSMFRRLLGGMALALFASAVGSANTISYYVELFVPTQNPFSNYQHGANYSGAFDDATLRAAASGVALHDPGTGVTGRVDLPQFNPTDAHLGLAANQVAVLTSVQLVIAWAAQGAVSVSNSLTSAQPFNSALSSVPIAFDGPGALDANVNATVGPYSDTVDPAIRANLDLTSNGALGQSICQQLHGTWNAGTHICSNAIANGLKDIDDGIVYTGVTAGPTINSGLGLYYGTSTVTIDVNASEGQYSGNAAHGVYFGGSVSGGALAEIIYNYDVVTTPEPIPVSLVGCALVALGCWKRRRI